MYTAQVTRLSAIVSNHQSYHVFTQWVLVFLSIIHTRLRNSCINLNNDLSFKKLKPNEIDQCGYEREDAEHYFMQCPSFTNVKRKGWSFR